MESESKSNSLYVERLLYPVTSLGPGKRIAIWVSGCRRQCYKCANPELWEQKPNQRIDTKVFAKMLAELFKKREVDGLTISGGEPMNQAEAILDIMNSLDEQGVFCEDILIFTGYKISEIELDKDKRALMNKAAVIIDGEYVDSQNDGISALKGSLNQNINYIKTSYKSIYENYLNLGRQIQNYVYNYDILSVGIHKGEDCGKD